jgi:predicted DNA-binding transcriptional regulator AlpA
MKPKSSTGLEGEQLWKKAQVASFCQVTPRCIDQWMKTGILPYIKLGRTVRFRPSDIQSYMDENLRIGRST